MAWPFSKKKTEAAVPLTDQISAALDVSPISTTEDMIIPEPPKPEEVDEPETPIPPPVPTTIFDTVVAKTTYALSDMFVIGNPYYLTISGKFLEDKYHQGEFSNMVCSGIAILTWIGNKRESASFLFFVTDDGVIYRFHITITAEDFNASVNAVAEGNQPDITIEPLIDVPKTFGFRRAPRKFFEAYHESIGHCYRQESVPFYNPAKH